jgi:proteasome lid subunit RPN8/RPN11
VIAIDVVAYEKMVASCLREYPLEACGILLGTPVKVSWVKPAANIERSARIYTVDPKDMLTADRLAEQLGVELVGVYHSHTHSEAFPSPTDVTQAPDPTWYYFLISLKRAIPEVRAYRIVEGKITETPLVVESSKMQ